MSEKQPKIFSDIVVDGHKTTEIDIMLDVIWRTKLGRRFSLALTVLGVGLAVALGGGW